MARYSPGPAPRPIAFLELALDVELTTGVLLPPLRGAQTPGAPTPRPAQQPVSLHHRSYTFATMWRNLARLTAAASLS